MKPPLLLEAGRLVPEAVARLLAREGTGISWADLTFNSWIGCQETGSPACVGCYAREFVGLRLNPSREKNDLPPVVWGPGGARQRTAPGNWAKPPRWDRIAAEAGVRLAVFCLSLGDWADNAVPDEWRADLAALIRATPNLVWMLLTKRIGNARKMLEAMFPEGVPENVALGVTIVTQAEAARDLPRAVSVKHGLGVRRLFVSAEPLMEGLNLTPWLRYLDLLIIGGESGQNARSMLDEWVDEQLRDCRGQGVPFHFKQQSQADHPRTYNKPATFPARHQVREHFA